MKLKELKTIDIVALGYRDTVNGNSYFSSNVILNHGLNNSIQLKIPFQYGYELQYLTTSLEEVSKHFKRSKWFKRYMNKDMIEKKYNIKITHKITRGCKKRELFHSRDIKKIRLSDNKTKWIEKLNKYYEHSYIKK
tara:strand:+ start:412 stop:819 length:408 start_codon:yes stop_codon:yes gene_type:complete